MGAVEENVLLNLVIRMVVPMKREFGKSLDVQQFLRDPDYARPLLEMALASSDTRLRDYAQQVSQTLAGARKADPPPRPGPHTAQAAMAPAATPNPAGEPTEEELRARMMRKYTQGLR